MKGFLTVIGHAVGILLDSYIAYRKKKVFRDKQDEADTIYVNPGSRWLSEFKRGQTPHGGKPKAKPGKPDDNGRK
jgi:hypothetical protein